MTSKSDFPRHVRVGDQIQRDLSQIIQRDLKDPRVPPLLTITAVELSRDLGVARVFVSSLIDDIDREAMIEILNDRAGYMRSLLGKRIRMRAVPILRFSYDDTTEKAMALSHKIDDALSKDASLRDDSSES